MHNKTANSQHKGPASTERRDFLKGAAAGAAALTTAPGMAQTRNPVAERPAVTSPGDARVVAETGPPPQQVDDRFVEHPAADYMVDVIKTLDLEYVTTNPGSSFEDLHESLINYGNNTMPEMLTCLHEESAVGMAHGYAKIEGKPIMALLHGPVGLLHASMAIYNAWADRVPVYIIAGNHKDPAGNVDPLHSGQDLGALVRDYVKWDDDTITIKQFAASALRAYKIAMTPPMGPVAVMIDHKMQGRPLDNPSGLHVPRLTMAAPPQGNANAVREAARLLAAAESPRIITGRSARTPQGIELLVELAELLQAPVSGADRVNFPWTHPLYGSGGSNYQADVILGLEVNDMSAIAGNARASGAKSISISSIDLFHGRNMRDYGGYAELDLSIAADAEATLPALIEEVRSQLKRSRGRVIQERGQRISASHRQLHLRNLENARYGWNSSPVSTARLSAELWNQVKEDDWSLVSWMGFISNWPGILWNIEKHYQYTGWPGAGGMGYGAQAAVGAALANRKHGRLSVNIQCDGDLNYAPGVLWTAVHHKIPLLTVMHNNRAYHAEVMFVQRTAALHRRGEDRAHIGTTIRDPDIDYAGMAGAYGMYSEGPIEDPEKLAPALHRALEVVRAGEPALIDVVTQPR